MEKIGTQGLLLGAAIAILVAGGVGYYVWNLGGEPAAPEPVRAAPPAAVVPPPTHYPVETPATAAPLPALNESDAAFGAEVAQMMGLGALPAWVYPDQMIRRLVVTVDNLPRARVASKLLPVQPVPGRFQVSGSDDQLAIAASNRLRYEPYVALMEKADASRVVDLYLRWYPRFQEAYVELGYPKAYFNDRLVAVLEDLLAAPEAPARVALVQPHVLYQLADPDLEELPAGQKILIRMGEANSARVKKALRALHDELVRRTPGGERR